MQKKHPMIWLFGFFYGVVAERAAPGKLKLSLTDALQVRQGESNPYL